jgi:RNA polymerase sigma-70 factor, ECF subfamily
MPLILLVYLFKTMDEKELIELAKQGNEHAFTCLYNKYHDKVRNNIKYIMKEDVLTDEILNETFLKVWLKLSTYVNDISLNAWIKMIAVNNCIDYIRRNKDDRKVYIDSDNVYLQLSNNSSSEAEVVTNENRDLVNTALSQIPFAKRRALELYYFKNLSYKEIAKLLRTPLGTVKSDINRSKKKLSKIIKK